MAVYDPDEFKVDPVSKNKIPERALIIVAADASLLPVGFTTLSEPAVRMRWAKSVISIPPATCSIPPGSSSPGTPPPPPSGCMGPGCSCPML